MKKQSNEATKSLVADIFSNSGELQALQNALSSFGMNDYEILHSSIMKKDKYCLRRYKNEAMKCLTGWWSYNDLNHFILGYGKAINELKLKP